MFGPNTYFTDNVNINYSHRDKKFFDLFARVRDLFIKKFNLENYDVLFIPGSGTIGVESAMFSMDYKINMIGNEGTFKNRWKMMLENYKKPDSAPKIDMFCGLETSVSAPFHKEGCFVDAMSSFPYYDIPNDTKAFFTCLNKQLASYIGLAVVCIRKDQWEHCISEDVFSYLNLRRYKETSLTNQTPHTTPTFIYEHYEKVLKDFNVEQFRERINKVSDLICSKIPEEYIIGEKRCPVITVKKEAFSDDKLSEKFDLYGYWIGKNNYQFFTYTSPYEDYEDFFKNFL